jgi:hypothetical protein
MGMFDTYEDVQLKVGPCFLNTYKVGDVVGLPDGVYLGYEGAVVVIDNKFTARFPYILNKWGGRVETADVINSQNLVFQKSKELLKKLGER